MQIQRLKLNDYRSYPTLAMCPAPGVNVITGENAQGKTNALEAIFLCALGRSHRTTRDAELIRWECPGAYVGLELTNRTGAHTIEVKLRMAERRQVLIDKQLCARSAELMGVLNAVLFSPEDLMLVKGAPAERRRFLDMEISQLRPVYYTALQRYNAALKQRNALLKDEARGRRELLFMWDEQLAAHGAQIMRARAEFIEQLARYAADLYGAVTGARETLRVDYRPSLDAAGDLPALTARLMERLSAQADEDARRGFTGTGPHRDDIQLRIDGADARVYGSQGQQRTAALSLKLCEIELMREQTGEYPLLLLDDVLSELDDSRARMLLKRVACTQSFLTCTDLEALGRAGLADYTVWNCRKGILEKVTEDG